MNIIPMIPGPEPLNQIEASFQGWESFIQTVVVCPGKQSYSIEEARFDL
jgi:hypothetical protein